MMNAEWQRSGFVLWGRWLSLLVSLVSFVLLAACGEGRGPEVGGPTTIEIWQGFKLEETAVFRQVMAELEKDWNAREQQKIQIVVHYVAYDDMYTKLRTAALADKTPDIAFMDAIKVTDLAFGQALVPLDELATFKQRYGTLAQAREQFVGASYDAGVVNRKGETHLYGLPVQTTTVALFWNRELFRARSAELRAAGLDPARAPRDWDELLAYAKVMTDAPRGNFGFGMQGTLWFNFPVFNMYNAEWIAYDAAGKATPTINSPYMAAALQRIRTIVNSGYEGGAWKRSALNPEQGFINRKYAMVLTGPWMVENFTNAGIDFDVALIPAPPRAEIDKLKLQSTDPTLIPTLGDLAWSSSNVGGQTGVLMKTARNAEIAFQVLDYFTSEAVQRRWASTLGQIPVRRAAWENLDVSKYPFMPKFMQQLQLSKRIPQIPLFGKLELDVFNPEMDLLLQRPEYPIDTMLRNLHRGLETNVTTRINEGS